MCIAQYPWCHNSAGDMAAPKANFRSNGRAASAAAKLTAIAARRSPRRYAAFDAARAFLCAMAAIGQKPDIRLREEMGVDIG
jgi:hypothetical protein